MTRLRLSEMLHLVSALLLLTAGWLLHGALAEAGWLAWAGTGIFLGLLLYQHLIVKPNDLRRVNLAFFTTNGIASLIFGVLTILDLFV